MAMFLFFFLSPFGIYFLTKWIVIVLERGHHDTYPLLRPLYLIAQALLLLILPCTFILLDSTGWYNYLKIELWIVWLGWPLYAAIYKQTKIYLWERFLFWGCTIYIVPSLLWIFLMLFGE
jgi:hypothetical protein